MTWGTHPVTPGSGANMAVDDISGTKWPGAKIADGTAGSNNLLVVTSAGDAKVTLDGEIIQQIGWDFDVSIDITRPADTTTYQQDDSWGTAGTGGYTFANLARISGGGGLINTAVFVTSAAPSLKLQGELFLFDSAVTAQTDNSAFSLAASDWKKLVGYIPFTVLGGGTGSFALVQLGGMKYHCVGSADLRALVRVKNAYIPASSETLTCRLLGIGTN